MRRRGTVVPLILLGAAFVGAIVLIIWGKALAAPLHEEVFKLLAQLVLVAGIGGAASLLFREVARARQKRDEEREILRKTLSDLLEAYNECKSVRRLLRARAIRNDHAQEVVIRDSYDSLLARLNDAQLRLEFYKKYLVWNPDLFECGGDLSKQLGKAEHYLGDVITEWEDRLRLLSDDSSKNPLDGFQQLKNMIDSATTGFGPEVADPIETTIKGIANAIAKKAGAA
jgi:hypothetical protein